MIDHNNSNHNHRTTTTTAAPATTRSTSLGDEEYLSSSEITNLVGDRLVDDETVSESRTGVGRIVNMVGTTRLHWKCILILGLCNAADAVEVLAIGYIVTVFSDPVTHNRIDKEEGWSGLLTSAVFIGMLIGGLLSGSLGDRYGRKPLLALSLLVNCASALVSSFTPVLPIGMQVGYLVFFRFVGGLGVGGSVPSAFALASEFGPDSSRSLFINVVACFWSVGALYTSVCAYILLHGENESNWPYFAALVSVPALVAGILCLTILEESPRFLYFQKDYVGLRQTMNRFIDSNADKLGLAKMEQMKHEIEEMITIFTEQDDNTFVEIQSENHKLKQNFMELSTMPLLKITIFVSGIFFFLSFAHYGINSWISILFEYVDFTDPYLTSLFYTFATVPGLAGAILLVDRLGRKVVTVGGMTFASVSAVMFSFNTHSPALVIFSAICFNASAAACWNALDVFSAESFPSHLRGTGLGISAACGRVGSIAANFFNSAVLARSKDDKTDSQSEVAIVLFTAGISMLLGGICAVILPETYKK